ncbi:MAG: 50S ribosomal protein L35 [Verrucomicrobia bacterium]|nr:50S ribosomal protein L35 [Verrucomicrobiota bacterium]
MQKTRKSISKRFKVTGTGKVMRRSPNTRHLLSSKSRKQRRRANKSKRVDSGFEEEDAGLDALRLSRRFPLWPNGCSLRRPRGH